MNKTISILAGLLSILLTFGVISNVAGREIAEQPAAAYDDGPALSGSLQTQQNESNEQAKNNKGDESDPAIASADNQTGADVPQMDPGKDSPDDPVKINVEGPVEERIDVKPVEDQNQGTTETKPATPAEIPSGDKPAADASSQPEQPPAVVPPKPKRELGPALVALRDKTRRTLGTYQKMPFNSRQNSPDEIIDCCLALGCNAEITLLTAEGEKRANGIMCLCWNYPCGGFQPLTMIDGHVSARLGYGVQSRPSQLLAALALARVQASYPMRVGGSMRTVADLVESEKLSCRSGTDMSLKLVGLAYYIDAATWKNDLDQEWSLEKIIKEELAQPTLPAGGAGLDCLLGLSYALSRHEKRNLPVEGQFARVKMYMSEFQKHAFGIQNSDGGWGYYLSGKGVNRDEDAGLRSSGYVLQWLALSLPEDRLDDPAMAAGMTYLINGLNSQRYLNNLPVLPTREIGGAMRALHALAIYDQRLFKLSDAQQPAADQDPSAATARHESDAGQSR
ncbi:MAG: hypothetical protein ABSE63_11840 [Thermoguttaceae bacterium]|jgi:hypothetical protein